MGDSLGFALLPGTSETWPEYGDMTVTFILNNTLTLNIKHQMEKPFTRYYMKLVMRLDCHTPLMKGRKSCFSSLWL